jgi:hypothetical protein
MSRDIQVAQQNRELNMSLGRTTSQVAGAGFSVFGAGYGVRDWKSRQRRRRYSRDLSGY